MWFVHLLTKGGQNVPCISPPSHCIDYEVWSRQWSATIWHILPLAEWRIYILIFQESNVIAAAKRKITISNPTQQQHKQQQNNKHEKYKNISHIRQSKNGVFVRFVVYLPLHEVDRMCIYTRRGHRHTVHVLFANCWWCTKSICNCPTTIGQNRFLLDSTSTFLYPQKPAKHTEDSQWTHKS